MEKKTDDIIFYGNLNDKNIQGYAYSVYGVNRISPTLTANSGGGHMPYILINDEINKEEDTNE